LLFTLIIVNFGWVLFRADGLRIAKDFILRMFGIGQDSFVGFTLFWYLDKWTLLMLVLGIFFASSIPAKIAGSLKAIIPSSNLMILKYISLLVLFAFCIIRVVSGTYNPFIYFQF
jgi:hypothetical protein